MVHFKLLWYTNQGYRSRPPHPPNPWAILPRSRLTRFFSFSDMTKAFDMYSLYLTLYFSLSPLSSLSLHILKPICLILLCHYTPFLCSERDRGPQGRSGPVSVGAWSVPVRGAGAAPAPGAESCWPAASVRAARRRRRRTGNVLVRSNIFWL